MSHNSVVKMSFKSVDALKRAATKSGVEVKTGRHKVKLYSGQVECDMSLKLPGWQYAVAINGEEVTYDNFQGRWGDIKEMETLMRNYATEVTTQELVAAGMSFDSSQTLVDGSVELVFNSY